MSVNKQIIGCFPSYDIIMRMVIRYDYGKFKI